MRRVKKDADSEVIKRKVKFKAGENDLLRQLLADEQHTLCAYTETYLGPSDDAHIEHFNPTLKGTNEDSYTNWFLVKSLWNTKKSRKWADYQPILHPTAEDLEQRILYFAGGHYVAADPNDVAAQNLIRLLDLDNARLADQRKRYVQSKKQQIGNLRQSAQQYIDELLVTYPEGVYFIRAIEEELDVKVNFDLLKTT
ncbi:MULTISPECIES: hypothetical protein [Spirosoma]|uniref:TIGR02646 family protein n=1 Tax=Spirosoma liriopis TaxID=2937440 RepID=A0ABT0HKA2_9BACT|nr:MULTISPECIES: hypothetical protein [Spirosoma]MCK8492020.1 hypothetical protein [Spirosoma liriopis]UHG91442.1 hypothetical protein LQ777_00750 [Spirosoma oryzicola]